MVAPYTATDLIRVMEHEMHHHHEVANRRRSLLRRGNGRSGGEPQVSAKAEQKPARRADGRSFFSLFSKPA